MTSVAWNFFVGELEPNETVSEWEGRQLCVVASLLNILIAVTFALFGSVSRALSWPIGLYLGGGFLAALSALYHRLVRRPRSLPLGAVLCTFSMLLVTFANWLEGRGILIPAIAMSLTLLVTLFGAPFLVTFFALIIHTLLALIALAEVAWGYNAHHFSPRIDPLSPIGETSLFIFVFAILPLFALIPLRLTLTQLFEGEHHVADVVEAASLISKCLAEYDTHSASVLLEELSETLDPRAVEAFGKIVENLNSYRSFLPPGIVAPKRHERSLSEHGALTSDGGSSTYSGVGSITAGHGVTATLFSLVAHNVTEPSGPLNPTTTTRPIVTPGGPQAGAATPPKNGAQKTRSVLRSSSTHKLNGSSSGGNPATGASEGTAFSSRLLALHHQRTASHDDDVQLFDITSDGFSDVAPMMPNNYNPTAISVPSGVFFTPTAPTLHSIDSVTPISTVEQGQQPSAGSSNTDTILVDYMGSTPTSPNGESLFTSQPPNTYSGMLVSSRGAAGGGTGGGITIGGGGSSTNSQILALTPVYRSLSVTKFANCKVLLGLVHFEEADRAVDKDRRVVEAAAAVSTGLQTLCRLLGSFGGQVSAVLGPVALIAWGIDTTFPRNAAEVACRFAVELRKVFVQPPGQSSPNSAQPQTSRHPVAEASAPCRVSCALVHGDAQIGFGGDEVSKHLIVLGPWAHPGHSGTWKEPATQLQLLSAAAKYHNAIVISSDLADAAFGSYHCRPIDVVRQSSLATCKRKLAATSTRKLAMRSEPKLVTTPDLMSKVVEVVWPVKTASDGGYDVNGTLARNGIGGFGQVTACNAASTALTEQSNIALEWMYSLQEQSSSAHSGFAICSIMEQAVSKYIIGSYDEASRLLDELSSQSRQDVRLKRLELLVAAFRRSNGLETPFCRTLGWR